MRSLASRRYKDVSPVVLPCNADIDDYGLDLLRKKSDPEAAANDAAAWVISERETREKMAKDKEAKEQKAKEEVSRSFSTTFARNVILPLFTCTLTTWHAPFAHVFLIRFANGADVFLPLTARKTTPQCSC